MKREDKMKMELGQIAVFKTERLDMKYIQGMFCGILRGVGLKGILPIQEDSYQLYFEVPLNNFDDFAKFCTACDLIEDEYHYLLGIKSQVIFR